MNFDLNDVRAPDQFALCDQMDRRLAKQKLYRAMVLATGVGSQELMQAVQVAMDVLNDYEYLANNYSNLYDVTRKAISKNQFLTKQINERTESET